MLAPDPVTYPPEELLEELRRDLLQQGLLFQQLQVQLERLAREVAALADRQREHHGALGELREGLTGEAGGAARAQCRGLAEEVAVLAERQREQRGALGELREGLANEEAARLAQLREARGRWAKVMQELRDMLQEQKVLRDREAGELRAAHLAALGALRGDLEDVRAEQQRLRHADGARQDLPPRRTSGPQQPRPLSAAPDGVRPELERNSERLIADMGTRLEEFTSRLEGMEMDVRGLAARSEACLEEVRRYGGLLEEHREATERHCSELSARASAAEEGIAAAAGGGVGEAAELGREVRRLEEACVPRAALTEFGGELLSAIRADCGALQAEWRRAVEEERAARQQQVGELRAALAGGQR